MSHDAEPLGECRHAYATTLRRNVKRSFQLFSERVSYTLHLAHGWARLAKLSCARAASAQYHKQTRPYSTTLSANSTTDAGIARLSALAVLRFRTNSNLVGCSTGKSAGFAPLKILSSKSAA